MFDSTAFVGLIRMLIGPVIFCTIVLGIGALRKAASVGRIGGLALAYFLTMSTVALAIGLTTLAAQGLRYAGLERLDWRGTAKNIILNVALGLAIVAMKVAVAH